MKLRKVQSNSKINDDFMKCCRWCHQFQSDGKCYNRPPITSGGSVEVYSVSEEGYLSETIEEVLESASLKPFKELEYKMLEWGISKKRIEEFNKLFKECYDNFSINLKEELDENITRCYVNHLSKSSNIGVEINDPENYCCKEWC